MTRGTAIIKFPLFIESTETMFFFLLLFSLSMSRGSNAYPLANFRPDIFTTRGLKILKINSHDNAYRRKLASGISKRDFRVPKFIIFKRRY